MKLAFLFPGQGSQAVGMGLSLYQNSAKSRDVFEEVNDTLSQKLTHLMFEGPAEELNKTENTQPALMAVSMALWTHLKGALPSLKSDVAFAGHSLGEYSALGALGALPISTLASLLQARGQAMQKAVPLGVGGMAALIGSGGIEQAEALCESCSTTEQYVDVANDNSAQQVVISGHKEAVDRAISQAKEFNFARAVALPVSAPFHSQLMKPAQEEMRDLIMQTDIPTTLSAPIYANVTGLAETNGSQTKQNLIEQIPSRVRWRETMQNLYETGVRHFVEVGVGNVLANLVKRSFKDVTTQTIQTLADVDEFITGLEKGDLA